MVKRLRKKKLFRSEQPLETTVTVSEVAGALAVNKKAYNAILVTDGSGSSFGKPTGSAARLWFNDEETLLFSRTSSGTSQTAELDAVLMTLRHLHGVKAHKSEKGCRLLIVTDSSLVERAVTQVAEDKIALYNDFAHPDCAAALLAIARRGFVFGVRRIGRNTTPVHSGVDAASRAARLLQDPVEAYAHALQKHIRKVRKNGKEKGS